MEAYVDDIVVKSRRQADYAADLLEVFSSLRKYDMCLNPDKCVFGVIEGRFLGFMISARGIEVNPEKVKAMVDLSPPRNVHEVQRFIGRVNYLSRFCSRLAERNLPFFDILRSPKNFNWTEQCQTAFEELRGFLGSLPTLSLPVPGEDLQLYLAACPRAVSAVLVRENDFPVYFISKALTPIEARYPSVEKIAFAFVGLCSFA